MIKLGNLLKEIEVVKPFNGRITSVQELESYLNFLERKEGKEIYNGGSMYWNRGNIIEEYEENNDLVIPRNVKSLYNLRYVEGNLNLTYCENLISLPNNLTVTENLFINETNISEIPNNLNIDENLRCLNNPLSEQYTSEEIKQIIIDKGGSVQEVYR
jgi:hypothetical protein